MTLFSCMLVITVQETRSFCFFVFERQPLSFITKSRQYSQYPSNYSLCPGESASCSSLGPPIHLENFIRVTYFVGTLCIRVRHHLTIWRLSEANPPYRYWQVLVAGHTDTSALWSSFRNLWLPRKEFKTISYSGSMAHWGSALVPSRARHVHSGIGKGAITIN